MTTISVTDQNSQTHSIDFEEGQSLMEALRDHGFEEISAICGGCCSCATCHVQIEKEQIGLLDPMEEDEAELLELSDNFEQGSSRLSCQIELHAGLHGLKLQLIDTSE